MLNASLLLITLSVSQPLTARTIPEWPVDEGCEYFSSTRGNSNVAKNFCISKEQDAYDYLKETWPEIDESVKSTCIDRVRLAMKDTAYAMEPFPYEGLAFCIITTTEQNELLSEKSFRP